MSGRDRTRGEAAVTDLRRASGSPHIELILADLSSLEAIRQMAAEVEERFPRLDVLINNAGLVEEHRRLTTDGIEAHFAVNVVAPFALTQHLLPLLRASAPSRVINLTGGLPRGKIDLRNMQATRSFKGLVTYTNAKKMMTAMSFGLARRLQGSGVTVNVVYPGNASTSMSSNLTAEMLPKLVQPLWPIIKRTFREDGGKSAAKASRSSVYAAVAPELSGVTGHYFDTNLNDTAPFRDALNPQVQEAIWAECLRLTAATLTPNV